VLWLGGHRVISELSMGSFVAFNGYVAMLVWPLRVSARISQVLDAEPQEREPRLR